MDNLKVIKILPKALPRLEYYPGAVYVVSTENPGGKNDLLGGVG